MIHGRKVSPIDMPIRSIIIEDGAEKYEHTTVILQNLDKKLINQVPNSSSEKDMSLDMDKETLRLINFKGEFLKKCPGTKEYICCGYQILNIGTNCPLDCSYCILQAYFNQPSLRIFVNLEQELFSIGNLIDSNPEKIFRIGTGEFTDSLALDHLTRWSELLTHFFHNKRNTVLEFKTKTDNINGLIASPFRERIIVSWSLNSLEISAREDHGAPSILKRLKAAKKCQDEGFIVGFHFDPLIRYGNWESGYLETVELLNKYIDPRKVAWMSMGCIRFIPSLKAIIRKRHKNTHILDGEFISGIDGKMRYFKPIRIEMYSLMKEYLDQWSKDLGLYLCMESNDIWLDSFGWSPENTDGLSNFLDNRVIKMF
jgi:spore photoproduct lyase